MKLRPGVVVALSVLVLVHTLAARPVAAADSAKAFLTSCAPCHGKEGRPSAVFAKQGVRDFTDAVWQKSMSDEQIEKAIREGKKGTMMAPFAKQFSTEELKGLVAYIRKLGAKK